MQRYSRQREVILENLISRCDHPTAEMVYMDVKEILPKISLGTVYRNLNGLSEENTIICFTIDGKDHFDGNPKPHLHLHCKSCGIIEDRVISEDLRKSFEPEFYDVSNVIVQGQCKNCRKQSSSCQNN